MNKLRLALVSPTFFPTIGGTEVFIYEIARRLVAQGHQVTLFSRSHRGAEAVEDLEGIQVIRGLFGESRWSIFPFQAWLLATLWRRRHEFDLLHQFHIFHAGGAVGMARIMTGKPLLTTLIGWDTYDVLRPVPRIFTPYQAWVMNRSDAVVAICREMVPHAIDRGCKRPIEVQYLGTDLERFHPDIDGAARRAELGIDEGQTLVFSVQRLNYIKRLETLLEAIARVTETAPHLRFVIGGRGPEQAKLEKLIDELEIGDVVRLIGFIPDADLPSYYAAGDVFVLHSTYETFGVVVADAMAAGRPVIATRVGSIPEVVAEGRSGLLVPPCDAEALAAAILELGHDPDARQRMGAAGREIAEERFDWDRVTQRYLETYEKMLAEH